MEINQPHHCALTVTNKAYLKTIKVKKGRKKNITTKKTTTILSVEKVNGIF